MPSPRPRGVTALWSEMPSRGRLGGSRRSPIPALEGKPDIENIRNGHAGATQIKYSRGAIARLVFPGKARPRRFGSKQPSLPACPPAGPQRAQGARWGRGGPSTRLAQDVGSAQAREKALTSAARPPENPAANAQRRPAPPWDPAPPGFSLFGRKNAQAPQARRAPLAASGAGTPHTPERLAWPPLASLTASARGPEGAPA